MKKFFKNPLTSVSFIMIMLILGLTSVMPLTYALSIFTLIILMGFSFIKNDNDNEQIEK